MIKNAYLVIDTPTKAILFYAPSRLTANALTYGMLNTKAVEFPIHPHFESEFFGTERPANEVICLRSVGLKIVYSQMKDCVPGDEIYKKRELLTLRSKYLYMIELLCTSQLTRTANLIDESLLPFITDQLKLSDPTTESYTPAIKEYAALAGISNDIAYQELMLKSQTVGLIRTRVQALYDRFSMMLTTISDVEELELVTLRMTRSLYLNSYV